MQLTTPMGLQLSKVIVSSPSVEHGWGRIGAFQIALRGPEHVIKIRYADLPGGLHVRAVAHGKDTIVYPVPGLTVATGQAALRGVRSSARMGHGPPLSA